MNPTHKKALQNNHTALVDSLDFQRTHLLDHLYSDGVLSAGDIEEIDKKESSSKRASFFLVHIITKRGPTAFEKFVQALVKEGQAPLAQLLDPELTKQYIEDVPVKHGTRAKLLKDNHLFLISNLDFDNTTVGDTMLENELLTPHKLEIIQNQSPNWRKARYFLLNILPKCGPSALDKFLESLKATEGQEMIYNELQRYLGPLDGTDYGGVKQEFLSEDAIIQLLDNPSVKAFRPSQCVTNEEAARLLSQGAYRMDKKVRGRAVIINNRFFVNAEERLGAECDLDELTNLFTNLHFNVVSCTNVGAQEIKDRIQIESEEVNHTDYDAFVLFILSHGMNGHVLGTDDKPVKVDDIVEKICSCKSLHNKPKLIFIQACRPDDDNEKIDLTKDVCFQANTYVKPPKIVYESLVGNQQLKHLSQQAKSVSDAVPTSAQANLANFKDLVIANSTVPGFLSWRNTDSGSFFVRYFVYVCSTRAHKEDLASILNIVNGLLTRRPKGVKFEQIGESIFRGISKKVYFFPNYFA